MAKEVKSTIVAKGFEISVQTTVNQIDYISLTDIAKYKSDAPDDVIKNWMRSRETIGFLGLWEQLNNPNFKPVEFDGFRKEAGRNAFTLSPKKWIEGTGAIGIQSKAGRYGGTFAKSSRRADSANLLASFRKIASEKHLSNDKCLVAIVLVFSSSLICGPSPSRTLKLPGAG